VELEKLEKFYKIHSKFYDATRKFFLFDRKKAVAALDVKPNDRVIDLACGTGLNIPFLLGNTSPDKIMGIDYSESMLWKARKKFPQIKFIKGDITNYKFDQKADKIIATYSLSMIDDWKSALINMKRNLKPSGILVILDFHQWRGVIKFFYPIFRWWLNKHGVNSEQETAVFLRQHFNYVEERIMRSGYNYIVVAKFPK
jgi:S-adenosylmethionine-diacylgycerolhomoserine-N-methlytransferase